MWKCKLRFTNNQKTRVIFICSYAMHIQSHGIMEVTFFWFLSTHRHHAMA